MLKQLVSVKVSLTGKTSAMQPALELKQHLNLFDYQISLPKQEQHQFVKTA